MLKKLLDALFLSYKGTRASVTNIKLVYAFDKRVLFAGCVSDVPDKWLGWDVQSVYPDTDARANEEYADVPEYNLPKIIEIF